MHWKAPFKRPLKTISKGGKNLGSHMSHATDKLTSKTYEAINDKVDSAVDYTVHQAQTMVEERLERVMADVQAWVIDEIERRRVGLLLLSFGISLGVLSSILLSFAGVYVLITLFQLPAWASYAVLGGLFAFISGILLFLGHRQLNAHL